MASGSHQASDGAGGARVIDVTEVLNCQKLLGFNARLLCLTFLAALTYSFEFGPTILLGEHLSWRWYESAAEFTVNLTGAAVAGILIPLMLGYLADRFGRRPVIVVTTIVLGLLALVTTVGLQLVPMSPRRVIGLSTLGAAAFGGVLPILVALVSEFAPKRARATMVIMMLCGLSFGGGLRMLLVPDFMQPYGSRLLLWASGLGPLAVACVLWAALPESVKYLALHQARRDDLVKLLKQIDSSLDVSTHAHFVISGERNKPGCSLFAGPLALLTPLYWISTFMVLIVFNFITERTLPLLASSGLLSSDQRSIGIMFLQFAGALGALSVMRSLDKFGFWPMVGLFACAIPVVVGIELDGFAVSVLLTGSWFCLVTLAFGNFATAASVYPTAVRAFALSLNFAVSRTGSGLDWLLDDMDLRFLLHAWRMFALAAVALGVGLIAALLIAPRYRALAKQA